MLPEKPEIIRLSTKAKANIIICWLRCKLFGPQVEKFSAGFAITSLTEWKLIWFSGSLFYLNVNFYAFVVSCLMEMFFVGFAPVALSMCT